MKLRKTAAAFLLVGFLASGMQNVVSPMSVEAGNAYVNRDKYTEGANGEALRSHMGSTYVVITNKDAALKLDKLLIDVHDEGDPMRTFCEVDADKLQAMCESDSHLAQVMASYDKDAVRVYTLTAYEGYENSEDRTIRRLCVSNRDIYQAVKLSESSVTSYYWDGSAVLVPSDAAQTKIQAGEDFDQMYRALAGEELLAEGSAIANMIKKYEDWETRYDSWASSVDVSAMTAEEVAASKKNAGVESDYEMLQYAFDAYEEFAAEYPDLIASVEPTVEARIQVEADFSTSSLWDKVGDLDDDGTVSSSDAAELLIAAANNGAGGDNGLSADAQQLADVNADGVFNAEDAALLLMYAAEQGSGSKRTLEAFVTQPGA